MLHMGNGRYKACDGSALWKEGLGHQKRRDDPRNDPARSDDLKKLDEALLPNAVQ